jgi:hypothetical protein
MNASALVDDPVVILKVLSDSTARTDIGAKNREYEATPSVQRYVVLEQELVAGTMFERMNGDWIGRLLRPDSILRMPEIGIEVPIRELYQGVEFTDAPPRNLDLRENGVANPGDVGIGEIGVNGQRENAARQIL